MDWDDLRIALAVARGGTLSAAGEALTVSHTTVGRRLRALEERLGARLFDATPSGFVPTEAGRDLVAVAERLEADVLALDGRIAGRDERLEGPLRVATLEVVFRMFRGLFTGFAARHPGVALTVAASDDEVSLTRREADVALRLAGAPPEHLVGRKVGRLTFAPYASRALVERVGSGAPLGAFPWIHWDERLGMRWLDAWLAERAPGARVVLRVDLGGAAMHDLIADGVGVQFLARHEGDADPRLVCVGDGGPMAARDLWLLTLPELRQTPRVRAFMDHMASELAVALGRGSA